MATIVDLPVELIETIIGDILVNSNARKDLANLRATCKRIDAILIPRVLSAICIDISDWGKARSLIRMASKPNRIHTFARNLKIRCLAPGAHPYYAPEIMITTSGFYTYPRAPVTDVDVIEASQIVIQYLHKALQHFHKLVEVEWWTHGYDNPICNTAVMDLICSQEHLRAVTINMSRDIVYPFPDLGRLKGLERLSLSFPRMHIRTPSMFLGTAQALRNCPNLHYFHLHIHQNYTSPLESSNIEEIYHQMAEMNNITTLRLEIPSAFSLSKHDVMNNMKQLTTLELRPESGQMGMNLIWRALKEQRVHLKSIKFNMARMVLGFADYLSSYSGVEKLLLSNDDLTWVDPEEDFGEIAASFFEAVVRHAATLQVLRLKLHMPKANPTWGPPGLHRLHLLSKLTALTKLDIDTCFYERGFLAATKLKEYGLMYKLLGLSDEDIVP